MFFRKPRPFPHLATTPAVYPAPDGVHMEVNIVFTSTEGAKDFLKANGLPTVVFDRK